MLPTRCLPAGDRYLLPRQRFLTISCFWLCAAETRDRRIRPRPRRFRPRMGCRRTPVSIDVGPFFSIHLSLCSADFHRLPRSYGEIRLLGRHRPVVVASFRSTVAVQGTDHGPAQISPGKNTECPARPPLRLPPQPRLDFGRHVHEHAHPAETASMEFTLVRCCGLPPASSPHDPRGES